MAAPTIVQSKTFTTNSDTANVSLNSNATAGNLLAILFSSFAAVGTPSVTGGGTWGRRAVADDGANNQVEGWTATATGGATTVAIDLAGSGIAMTGVVYEISGTGGVTVEDDNEADSPSTTSVSSGSVTVAGDALLLAGMTHDGGDHTITPSGGWTEDYKETNNNALQCFSGVHDDVTAGSHSHTWTIGATVNGFGVIIALKEAGGGGGGTANPWYAYAQQ